MADRFPLILNTSANQIQEITSGDQLDLSGNNIANAGIITATSFSGPIVAGAGVSNITSGIGTFTDLRVGGDTSFSEDLVVTGNARVTGILTVGTSSIILNDSANTIKVGTALTLGHTQGLQFHTQNLHSAGFDVNQINVSGASTIGGNLDANGDLDVDGHTNLDNVSIAGVTTIATNTTIGGNLTVNGTNTILNTTTYVQGGEGADGILAIYADEGDDNADKWRLRSATNGAFYIDNYSSGSWQTNFVASPTTTQLYAANYVKVNTTTNGINVYNGESGGTSTINVTKGSGDAEVVCQRTGGSGVKLRGSHPVSFLETTTDSDLRIRRNTDTRITLGSSGNTIAGSTTFQSGITGTTASFSGNVSIGGTLTYEDVTNIDSVGIITARDGINVSGGSCTFRNVSVPTGNISINSDTGKLLLGASNDLHVFHEGNHSYIQDNGTGALYIGSNGGGVYVRGQHGKESIIANSNGNVSLYYNNSLKFTTETSGVNITGVCTATSFVGGGSGLTSLSGSVIASALSGQNISGLGNIGINANLTARKGIFNDDGSTSPTVSISTDDASPWALQIKNDTYWNSASNGFKWYQDNSGNCYSTVQGNGAFVNHYLQTINGGTTNTAIHIDTNRAVHLNYQNANKLSTTTDGATITDSVKVNGASNGGQTVVVSSGTKRGSTIGVTNTASAGIFWSTGDGYGIYKTAGAWSGNYQQLNIEWITGIHLNGGTSYGLSGVRFSSHALPTANNTYDLGNSSLRWRNIYTNDLNLSNEGGKNEVDGTWGNYTIQEGESDLFLINKRSGKKYKFNLTEVN